MKTDNTTLKKLTRGEEEVMQILWQLGAGSINDLIAAMQEPKPKYTTIATFVKILENKGYVGRTERGKSYEYYPLVPKEEYAKTVVSSIFNMALRFIQERMYEKHRRVVGPNGFFLLPARRPFDTRNRTNPRHHPASPT